MDAATCNQRVEELTTQARQLENERDALKAKRHNLDLPALKHDFLDQILNNLMAVVDAVPPGQTKHLLHLLVKKVLIPDSRTAGIWYRLPQESPVRTLSDLVASMGQYANPNRNGYREIVFSMSSRNRNRLQLITACKRNARLRAKPGVRFETVPL